MHRRPLGRGRTLAALAGVLIVVGCVLPWWKVGGGSAGSRPSAATASRAPASSCSSSASRPSRSSRCPYAAGDRPLGIDRWLSYLLLTVVGWIGLAVHFVGLLLDGAFQFTEPAQVFTNGPGLWLVVIGLIVLSRATYDMAREPAYR